MTARTLKPARSVRVENIPPMTVAYVRHTGPYAGDAALFQRLFGRLMQWAGPRGFAGPGAKSLVIYHDNPEITAAENLRTSCCLEVPAGTTGSGDVGVMEVPGGACALARYELDATEFGAAWDWVYGKWMPESGYQPDDRPCYELQVRSPEDDPDHRFVVDIVAPVRPL